MECHLVSKDRLSPKIGYLQVIARANPGAQSEIFQGTGGFVELEHFGKLFAKKTKKRPRRGKFWSFFS